MQKISGAEVPRLAEDCERHTALQAMDDQCSFGVVLRDLRPRLHDKPNDLDLFGLFQRLCFGLR
jgi:hypothetical protein